ncbi:MinD/ParA family ATP-binding protein [Paeniglutamicibacter gangotriensis]|uniref:MinD/ParA family ATP-binding protein n=1 Tax=Paeniglutamicibacter gangotriensis TaxID=254787 RepID=UPI0021D2524D|nr:ParA family protein [Paeniglutamicibacter gangotriensis]
MTVEPDWPGTARRRTAAVSALKPLAEPPEKPPDEETHSSDRQSPASGPPPNQPPAGLVRGRRSAAVFKEENMDRQLPAGDGWQRWARTFTAGLWKPAAGKDELERRNDISTIQRVFPRPMTVFVTQPLGGAGKTMVSVGIGSTFGIHSTLDTLVWDNNETMGSLGIRTNSNGSRTTVCDLLEELPKLQGEHTRKGDLSFYTRHQGNNRFSALISDEDPERMKMIGNTEFNAIRTVVERFYNIVVVDSGNNTRADNWLACLDETDQLVIPVTLKQNSVVSMLRMIEQLESMSDLEGTPRYEELCRRAVIVITPGSQRTQADPKERRRLRELVAEAVGDRGHLLDIPFDPALDTGAIIDWQLVSDETRRAFERICARIADGLYAWALDEKKNPALKGTQG